MNPRENYPAEVCAPATQATLKVDMPTRARLKELFALAGEAVTWAEEKGVKRGEQCILREMCERLWWAD